ncbi:glycerate kinase type-2 family protein [Blastochloris viridis]|uniref:D-glycerate 2-kinase n=1 Tax=Blastochloris viridis TaxID=1079 RepID=A0A0H5BC47_BLAVI|nr:glycerate kinase [Blastochloris viridis]ALK08855.1 Putative hydroxypyruvate reductase [Blastochloris viridis]BAR97846.1 D-glycerate 2-kinase [Blastochloris viridis]CUU41516.1 MOFRL family protein [Blastochloris viridis]
MPTDPCALLRRLADIAIAHAAPSRIATDLPPKPAGRTVVVGAGKASAAMAQAFEAAWPHPLGGLVVTRYGHAVPCRRIEIVEAAHPVPDDAGASAARRMLELVSGLAADDLVVALMSGGGSALLTLPAPGLSLADLKAVNAALLRSGADIAAMNCVRKHLSAISGGRLAAAAYPARLWTYAISDVAGDDLAVIASGPTVPDPSTLADARAVVARYGLPLPAAARARLLDPAAETIKPGDGAIAGTVFRLIARPLESLRAAADAGRAAGLTPLILGDAITGEAREVGAAMAGIARAVAEHGLPVAKPAVLLSGGETTVTVRGSGKGGRNTEFLLGFALAAAGIPGVYALAVDTDGIDGSEDNAGAVATPDTLARLKAAGRSPTAMLADNDAYSAFAAIGDLVVTGPTRTNVNDFRAVLVI